MSKKTAQLIKDIRRGTAVVLSFPVLGPSTPDNVRKTRLFEPVVRGTAIAVASNRFISCNHVLQGSEELKLLWYADPADGLPMITYDVVSVQHDRQLDLVLMKVQQERGEVLPIKLQVDRPQIGTDILAAGYPLPIQQEPEIRDDKKQINVAITTIFRAVRGIIASRMPDGLHFEIDKVVNPGQSGGPVVALETGELVGMCQGTMFLKALGPVDLSVCLSVEAISKKLMEWGVA